MDRFVENDYVDKNGIVLIKDFTNIKSIITAKNRNTMIVNYKNDTYTIIKLQDG